VKIGEKLRKLRMSNSLTQEELASRADLTKGYISQLENDGTSPSISTLKDLLDVLGISMSEFFAEKLPLQVPAPTPVSPATSMDACRTARPAQNRTMIRPWSPCSRAKRWPSSPSTRGGVRLCPGRAGGSVARRPGLHGAQGRMLLLPLGPPTPGEQSGKERGEDLMGRLAADFLLLKANSGVSIQNTEWNPKALLLTSVF
jgi:transcriptional regulator with XRE-family HTH domain